MNHQSQDVDAEDELSQLQYEQDEGQQEDPSDPSAAGTAQDQDFVGSSFGNVAQGLSGHYRNIMMTYWQNTINSIENDDHEFKIHQLPLARIKKVMKADEDVKMISAEAPILFAKGCDIFITELTMRAWIHAEENKRRTLQRSDIASALQKSDMFDFLIDIVPREEAMASSSSLPSRRNQKQAQYVQYEDAEYQAQVQAQAAAAAAAEEGQQQEESEVGYNENDGRYENQSPQRPGQQHQPQPGQQAGQQMFSDLDNIYQEYRQY